MTYVLSLEYCAQHLLRMVVLCTLSQSLLLFNASYPSIPTHPHAYRWGTCLSLPTHPGLGGCLAKLNIPLHHILQWHISQTTVDLQRQHQEVQALHHYHRHVCTPSRTSACMHVVRVENTQLHAWCEIIDTVLLQMMGIKTEEEKERMEKEDSSFTAMVE